MLLAFEAVAAESIVAAVERGRVGASSSVVGNNVLFSPSTILSGKPHIRPFRLPTSAAAADGELREVEAGGARQLHLRGDHAVLRRVDLDMVHVLGRRDRRLPHDGAARVVELDARGVEQLGLDVGVVEAQLADRHRVELDLPPRVLAWREGGEVVRG